MNPETGFVKPIWRPRPQEDRDTVRRQQKELRRIRQKARRNSMTEEQIEQRRERGREYYLRRKIHKIMKKREFKNVSVSQPRVDNFVECTTAEQVKEQVVSEYAYQCQKRENHDEKLSMKQMEQINRVRDQERMACDVQSLESSMRRKRNRLTNVKREARNRYKDVRPLRVIHIKRQARKLGNGVVDRTCGNGNYFAKLGSFSDKNALQEHAQILLDISRMNGHSSAAILANSRRPMQIKLNEGANRKRAKVCEGGALEKDENSEDSASDIEENDSESEEVIAFLTGLSAKRGQC